MKRSVFVLNVFLIRNFFVMVSCMTLLAACAVGTTEVKVAHDPFNEVSNKREGHLLLKEFVDLREHVEYIGNKRNGFGMVLGHIGLYGEEGLEPLLTRYFAEALRESGYEVSYYKDQTKDNLSDFDAIIEGEIIEFWMDLYMQVWHRVTFNVKALDPLTETILWQSEIKGAENRVLWVGATGEYERIIREALTKALNKAMEEVTSDEFYHTVMERK